MNDNTLAGLLFWVGVSLVAGEFFGAVGSGVVLIIAGLLIQSTHNRHDGDLNGV